MSQSYEEKQATLIDWAMETRIESDAASVWTALTAGIGEWWPDAVYSGGDPESRSMTLDLRPGGLMVEDWGDQGGLLWAQVLHFVPEKALTLTGVTSPRWGGPQSWIGEFTLEEEGDAVRLRFHESTVGRTDAENFAGKEKGWSFLWAGALKAHCEGREEPSWETWVAGPSPDQDE